VIKDTPAMVRLAERLIAAHDLAEPEVMLEVEVLEVGSNRLVELGLRFPDSLAVSVVGAGGAGTLTLQEWRTGTSDMVRFSFTDPLFLFLLRQQDGSTKVLANPRIRVKNKEKARIHIGDRVPVITTTAAATGGFVSESVNYLDVGLKLEVEPLIHLEDEVGIKVGLEVSNIAREVRGSTSGSLTYQIGTRNAATTLRLRDGETQILAGLISDEERKSASRVPGLGDLPVIGRLFSQTRDNSIKTEIVLLITPRLVRTLARPEVRGVEFAAGTEASGGAGTFGGGAPPPPPQQQTQPAPQPEKPPAASGGQPQGNTMVPFGGVQQPR
jgi:general secretion pathway protein D